MKFRRNGRKKRRVKSESEMGEELREEKGMDGNRSARAEVRAGE